MKECDKIRSIDITTLGDFFAPMFAYLSIIVKTWGEERIIISNDRYCAKILYYSQRGNYSSDHFHRNKHETWFCFAGSFEFFYYDNKGNVVHQIIKKGDIVHLSRGVPHQLVALEDESQIFEASTHDNPNDVIRISPSMD